MWRLYCNIDCESVRSLQWYRPLKKQPTKDIFSENVIRYRVYPKKYAHGFCFVVLCCGYTLTDFPISIRLTSLALWQSNDCPSASKATLMNMDKYFMWIHYERLHNHNKAMHNKTVCIFLGIYCNHCLTNMACWYFPRNYITYNFGLYIFDQFLPLWQPR